MRCRSAGSGADTLKGAKQDSVQASRCTCPCVLLMVCALLVEVHVLSFDCVLFSSATHHIRIAAAIGCLWVCIVEVLISRRRFDMRRRELVETG